LGARAGLGVEYAADRVRGYPGRLRQLADRRTIIVRGTNSVPERPVSGLLRLLRTTDDLLMFRWDVPGGPSHSDSVGNSCRGAPPTQ
jgi:hypothetical protein